MTYRFVDSFRAGAYAWFYYKEIKTDFYGEFIDGNAVK
jgi:hypothetical protein